MIDTLTEQRIIHKRAEGKSYNKIAKELSLKSSMPIRRIEKNYGDKITQKSIELKNKSDSLNSKILFYAKNKLLAQLKDNKKISENILANVLRAVDTIQRLDDNKPTSISSSNKDYSKMTNKELEYETKRLLDAIRTTT